MTRREKDWCAFPRKSFQKWSPSIQSKEHHETRLWCWTSHKIVLDCVPWCTLIQSVISRMVQTSKTDHFFKLAPFWSPLTDLIDFGMAGKLLTAATRWCSPFVDSVSRIWLKPKKSLIGCWPPTATTFGQSAPSRVQLTAGRHGHNRHFERPSLVSSVRRSLCTGKIELYVSWAAYFRGVLPWLQRTAVKPVGFACTGAISPVIVKVTSSSDLEKIRVRSKSTRRQAGRFQRRGLLRTLNKQFWER